MPLAAIRHSLAALFVTGVAFLATNSAQAAAGTATVGQTVTFSVTADGTTPFTYQWTKNGANITGATAATYAITNVQLTDAGTYAVAVSNAAGSATSDGAVLTVNPAAVAPVFTTQPVSQTATAGGSVTFTAAASGSPTPTYQWRKNGTNISGATSASYTIASVVAGDAGTYTVVATNTAGSATSNGAVLTVNVAPVITTQPTSQTVTAGASVTFTAAASGSPAPTYQWRKNGTNISGATSASYTIASVVASDAATYTVVATNTAGSATSNGAVLTVNAAPAFTTQPTSQTVTAGASVTFTAAANGSPAPTYQWRKNGANIPGATSASYTIASVGAGDAGTYTVVATNTAGSATSNGAVLTVNTAPAITGQPTNQTVVAGQSATFTVAATGNPAPTYQWQRSTDGGSTWANLANDTSYSGVTTAALTISSPTAVMNANQFRCLVSNSVASVVSSPAVLTVNVPPSDIEVSIQIQ